MIVPNKEHLFPERFNLMKYASDDGHVVEWLWNSRNGVTPFMILAKDGETDLRHADWQGDIKDPDHIPMPGDRVFVDWSKEDAKKFYHKMTVENWNAENYPTSAYGDTVEEVAEALVRDGWREGDPCVRTVAASGWPNLEEDEEDTSSAEYFKLISRNARLRAELTRIRNLNILPAAEIDAINKVLEKDGVNEIEECIQQRDAAYALLHHIGGHEGFKGYLPCLPGHIPWEGREYMPENVYDWLNISLAMFEGKWDEADVAQEDK
jgi:hypothetical protein